MSKMAKPAAGDGGSRQCIGSEQNHGDEVPKPKPVFAIPDIPAELLRRGAP
jgi:hypothetical protein